MGQEEAAEGAINGGEERAGLADAPYDRWVLLRPAEGSSRPSARYKHAAEVVQDKIYVVGGSRNGRSLSDVQVFDFKTSKWSVLNPRLLQSPAAAAAAASVTAAYAVTAAAEKTKDIVATDDLDVKRAEPGSSSRQIVAEIDALNGEKVELESRLTEVRAENAKLKDKLDMVKLSYGELTKELRSVENQLAAEGSRCQKLESQIAVAHKRLESAGSLENELEVLQQQISQEVQRSPTTNSPSRQAATLQ
ncbi:hypothetical protein ACQ4PT_016685 [Festuca glaucescens]